MFPEVAPGLVTLRLGLLANWRGRRVSLLMKGASHEKKRILVLLAAAAVAVAMFAVSGSAWGQDAELGNGDAGVTAPQGDPVIKPRKPKPGSNTTDRTPTIRAKVFDRDRQLKKKQIRLKLDDNQIRGTTSGTIGTRTCSSSSPTGSSGSASTPSR